VSIANSSSTSFPLLVVCEDIRYRCASLSLSLSLSLSPSLSYLCSKSFSARELLGGFVCLTRGKRESTSRCSLCPEVHAINHAALLIVLKLCHARVTSLFHIEESQTSWTRLSLRAAIEIALFANRVQQHWECEIDILPKDCAKCMLLRSL